MQQSRGCVRVIPDSSTYLRVSVKSQEEVQKCARTEFKKSKLVLSKIDKVTETQCSVMRTRAVPLDRPILKKGVNQHVVNGKARRVQN